MVLLGQLYKWLAHRAEGRHDYSAAIEWHTRAGDLDRARQIQHEVGLREAYGEITRTRPDLIGRSLRRDLNQFRPYECHFPGGPETFREFERPEPYHRSPSGSGETFREFESHCPPRLPEDSMPFAAQMLEEARLSGKPLLVPPKVS